jgi:hypothetical protein
MIFPMLTGKLPLPPQDPSNLNQASINPDFNLYQNNYNHNNNQYHYPSDPTNPNNYPAGTVFPHNNNNNTQYNFMTDLNNPNNYPPGTTFKRLFWSMAHPLRRRRWNNMDNGYGGGHDAYGGGYGGFGGMDGNYGYGYQH